MGGLYQVTDMGTGASCAGVGDAGLPSRTDGTSVFAARPVMPARPKVMKYYAIAGMMVAMILRFAPSTYPKGMLREGLRMAGR